jgi:hypothetical protein
MQKLNFLFKLSNLQMAVYHFGYNNIYINLI